MLVTGLMASGLWSLRASDGEARLAQCWILQVTSLMIVKIIMMIMITAKMMTEMMLEMLMIRMMILMRFEINFQAI